MAKLPYMQFYPADWIQDTQVLTSAAKGAWMDILCQLWISETPGIRTWTQKEFKTLLRLVYDEEIEEMVSDLSRVGDILLLDEEENEVELFENCCWITIKSRRMVRDRACLNARKETNKKYYDSLKTSVRQQQDAIKTRRSQKSEVRSQISELREEKKKTPLPPKGELAVVDDFHLFWNAYPRKIGGKKKALQAWNKATDKPPLVDILQAIEFQKESEQWLKDNGQFIPYPSTWLNQGRWNDEVSARRPSLMEEFLARGKSHANGSRAILQGLADAHFAAVGKDLSGSRERDHGTEDDGANPTRAVL